VDYDFCRLVPFGLQRKEADCSIAQNNQQRHFCEAQQNHFESLIKTTKSMLLGWFLSVLCQNRQVTNRECKIEAHKVPIS